MKNKGDKPMLSKEEIEKDIKILKNISECFTYSMWNEDTEALRRVLQYTKQLESDKQKLIEKLEKDIVNITKTLQDGKHSDDYSRCRLKAYRTKTKEILKILKGEKK